MNSNLTDCLARIFSANESLPLLHPFLNYAVWVHAYLHRKEGDIWNADYWYARAKKTRLDISLDQEWASLIEYFLA